MNKSYWCPAIKERDREGEGEKGKQGEREREGERKREREMKGRAVQSLISELRHIN